LNDADQLVQDAEYTYVYDAEGRRISRTNRLTAEVTTYGYNALDQMTSLVEDGTTWTFVFDAQNLRVLVTSEDALGFETYGEAFVYDLRKTVRATYDTSGVRTASYVAGSGFGEVLAMIDGAGVESYGLRDRLGTTVGWVDAGGGLSFTVRDAYGVRGIAPAGVVPFGYTGHAEDPTGLVWGRARCMAPTTGAWTSEDPVWSEPRFAYSRGKPASLVDPTGRVTAIEFGKLACLGAADAMIVSGGTVVFLSFIYFLDGVVAEFVQPGTGGTEQSKNAAATMAAGFVTIKTGSLLVARCAAP
jgi:RHS repeat-associated protein